MVATLPIEEILPDLLACLQQHNQAVVIAPPGAGKTTRIPLALRQADWLADGRIIMLEPRRLAARNAACYMAAQLGEPVGQTVGYRTRFASKVSAHTRVEVVTEGILTRMLQRDPSLEGIAAVLFDEFHERSIAADLGLAFCLEAQQCLRPDLKLVVMSATLAGEQVAALLGDAPLLTSAGQAYPVATVYLPQRLVHPSEWEEQLPQVIHQALARENGDILVFLPGAPEIRKMLRALPAAVGQADILWLPLYGQLSQAEQELVFKPAAAGQRKIILATAIAESSLTVDGVRIVIDCGWSRRPSFSFATGITRLETVRVAAASAAQRRGRAGRQRPGICYRLWSEEENTYLTPFAAPEILAADTMPVVLEAAIWGAVQPDQLRWLDAPPLRQWTAAQAFLQSIGALAADGRALPYAARLAGSGLHPRLAHMICQSERWGWGRQACLLAAVLTEKDVLLAGAGRADIRLRLEVFNKGAAGGQQPAIEEQVYQRIVAEEQRLCAVYGIARQQPLNPELCGVMLLFAYPERLGKRRNNGGFTLANGRGVEVADTYLSDCEYLVVADVNDQLPAGRVLLAAPVQYDDIVKFHSGLFRCEQQTSWESETQSVRCREVIYIGNIVVKEQSRRCEDEQQVLAALLAGIRAQGLDLLPWSKASVQLRERLAFLQQCRPQEWPDVADDVLLAALEFWLAPFVHGMSSRADLSRLPLAEALLSLLSWEQRRLLTEWAPEFYVVPSGRKVMLSYADPQQPLLAVKLQELFGWQETPRLGGGQIALTIALLSPAGRPVQVTRDLASFWREGYFAVKKELQGRYPKHYWPEDPLTAVATTRVRPK